MSKKGIIYSPPDLSMFDGELQRINDAIEALNAERTAARRNRSLCLRAAYLCLPEVPATYGNWSREKDAAVRLVRYTKASVWVSMSAGKHSLNNPTRCSRKSGSEHGKFSHFSNRIRITDLDALEAAIAAHERGEK